MHGVILYGENDNDNRLVNYECLEIKWKSL